jgi:hypothetical protein
MQEKLNLSKALLSFLKERAGEKFTARQIAEWARNLPRQADSSKVEFLASW